ncbi:putative SurA domain protein [Rickettsiales endosymbiont of Paramecium tredecaurelia]|uniref:SurA N-terminal domain-containing protein n=1 Tax=Candidatus Sarmatiella mevalonica TaxID=2770581 RepID=UPI00192220A1|nr:SurA N-terminal domain-containing protein [Candidatus Sarmatiella mevalonica]MBL3285062.1 putative SurA domain protein [Candidatus Sarmatiella mevalonica]
MKQIWFVKLMNKFLLRACLLCFLCISSALASIVATVNNKPITAYDLDHAMRMMALFNNVDLDQDRPKWRNATLQQLIDRQLIYQYAKKQGMAVSDAVVQAQIREISKSNKLPPDGLVQMLKNNNIDPKALEEYIRTDILFHQVFMPQGKQPDVSDYELSKVLLAGSTKIPKVSMVVFSAKSDDKKIQQQLAKIRMQIMHGSDYRKLKLDKIEKKEISGELNLLDHQLQSIASDLCINAPSKLFYYNNNLVFVLLTQRVFYDLTDNEKRNATGFVLQKKVGHGAQMALNQLKRKAIIKVNDHAE